MAIDRQEGKFFTQQRIETIIDDMRRVVVLYHNWRFAMHCVFFFFSVLASSFVIPFGRNNAPLLSVLAVACGIFSCASIVSQICFRKQDRVSTCSERNVAFFVLVLLNGIVLTIIFVFIFRFAPEYAYTNWISYVVIFAQFSCAFALNNLKIGGSEKVDPS